MLAQASTIVAIAVPAVGFGAIIGVYVMVSRHKDWVSKHMANTKIHPEKEHIVYKDVCVMQHKLENKRADERHEELKAGFDKLEALIRSNGK